MRPAPSSSRPRDTSGGDAARQRRDLGRLRLVGRGQQVGGVAVPPAAPEPQQVAHDELGMVVGRPQVGPGGQLGIGLHGVEDGLGRLAAVHALQHLGDDAAQVARGVGEHLLHGLAALHHEAVAGEEPLRAEARHLLQRIGPVDGVALHLLRIAAVRRVPDDEVAGEELTPLGNPHPAVVVGLAAGGVQRERELSRTQHQRLAEGQRRPVEALGKERRRQAELALVDARIPAMGELIAREAPGTVLLGDDLGALSGLEEGAQAEGVIRVTVGVDRRPQRRVAPAAHAGPQRGGALHETGIDDHEAIAGVEDIGVDEGRMHPDAIRHFVGLREEPHLRAQRIGRHHR